MQHRNRWMAVILMIGGLSLSGCSDKAETRTSKVEPAHVEDIEGKDVKLVVLTERAIERLDIKTVPVNGAGAGMTLPYAAVIYDEIGGTWVYTSPEARHFVRHSITVDRIEGDRALLSAGPPAGTKVVTVGAAELLGAEFEIGH